MTNLNEFYAIVRGSYTIGEMQALRKLYPDVLDEREERLNRIQNRPKGLKRTKGIFDQEQDDGLDFDFPDPPEHST